MKADEVWVIYNKYENEVVWVCAEQFLAQRQWDFMVDFEVDNPKPIMVKNRQKLVICTLQRALDEIAKEHLAQLDSIKEEKAQAEKWQLY